MKKWLMLAAVAVLSGCANQIPYKRPMQDVYKPVGQDVQVYTYAAKEGIGVRYFLQDSSAAGAPYGLLGALVATAMDGIMNAGPKETSARMANMLATGFDLLETEYQLQAALASELKQVPWLRAQDKIKHAEAGQRLEADKFAEPAALLVSLNYSMSPDLAHLNLNTDVRLMAKSQQYQPLYPEEAAVLAKAETDRQAALTRQSKKKQPNPDEVPADQRSQIYRNQFTYISADFPVATRTQQEVDDKIAEIRARYKDANGKLTKDKDKISKMNREIKAAKEPEDPAALAERRAAEWLANDGARLKAAIAEGVVQVAKLLARDLQETAVPNFNAKAADDVENDANSMRRIVRKAGGYQAGQYISEPLTVRPQFWNAINYGDAAAAEE